MYLLSCARGDFEVVAGLFILINSSCCAEVVFARLFLACGFSIYYCLLLLVTHLKFIPYESDLKKHLSIHFWNLARGYE